MDLRHALLDGCRMTAAADTTTAEYVALVDANAMLRSGACGPQSPDQIVKTLLRKIRPGCKQIIVVFDAAAPAAYPPQRALVHAKRYPVTAGVPDPEIARMIALFGAKTADELVSTSAALLPLINSRKINWKVCFNCRPLKMFVWRLFTMALRRAAFEMLALGELNCPVLIYSSNMDMVHSVQLPEHGVQDKPMGRYLGEADPQIFAFACILSKKGIKVGIWSIDTDFLLMAIGNVFFVPSAELLIWLKEGVTDAGALIQKFGGDCPTARLNSFFWCVALGADYCKPLTTQGYSTKALAALAVENGTRRGDDAAAATRVFTVTLVGNKCTCTFSVQQLHLVLSGLPRRNESKGKPRAPLMMAVNDVLFCVAYYGLMFDERIQPFPDPPAASRGTEPDTCTISWQLD